MSEEREDLGRLDNRMVILTSSQFKYKYSKMCESMGENPSERIRAGMEKDLAAYKAKQVPK
jgi:hypothetical protein